MQHHAIVYLRLGEQEPFGLDGGEQQRNEITVQHLARMAVEVITADAIPDSRASS